MLVGSVRVGTDDFVLRRSADTYVLFIVAPEGETEVLCTLDEGLCVGTLGKLLLPFDTMELRVRLSMVAGHIVKARGLADTMTRSIKLDAREKVLDAAARIEEFKP